MVGFLVGMDCRWLRVLQRINRGQFQVSVNNLNGQGVKALINEILHCIIHKPVARHATLACKRGAGNADAKVRAKALFIGPRMARMGGTFVQHFEVCGMKLRLELQFDVVHADGLRPTGGCGCAHGVVPVLMCLLR